MTESPSKSLNTAKEVSKMSDWEPLWHKKLNVIYVSVMSIGISIDVAIGNTTTFYIFVSLVLLQYVTDTIWFLMLPPLPGNIKPLIVFHHVATITYGISVMLVIDTCKEVRIPCLLFYVTTDFFMILRDGHVLLPQFKETLKISAKYYFVIRTFTMAACIGFYVYLYLDNTDSCTVAFIMSLIANAALMIMQILWLHQMLMKRFQRNSATMFRNVLLYGIFVEHFALWSILIIYIPDKLDDGLQVGIIWALYSFFHALTAVLQGLWSDVAGVTNQVMFISTIKCAALPLFYLSDDNFAYLCFTASFSAIFGSICTPYKVYISRSNAKTGGDATGDIALLVIMVTLGAAFLAVSGALLSISDGVFFIVIISLKMFSILMIGSLFSHPNLAEYDERSEETALSSSEKFEAIRPVSLLIFLQFMNHLSIDTLISQAFVFMDYHFDTSEVEIGCLMATVFTLSILGPVLYTITQPCLQWSNSTWNLGVGMTSAIIAVGAMSYIHKYWIYTALILSGIVMNTATLNIIGAVDKGTNEANKGFVMGVQDAADYLGSAFGGLVGGLVADAYPSKGMLYVVIGSSVIIVSITVYQKASPANTKDTPFEKMILTPKTESYSSVTGTKTKA